MDKILRVRPTYAVVYDRFRGKYVASASSHPEVTVVDEDPHAALAALLNLLDLLG